MLAWLLQCNPRCDYLQRVANKDQRWPPGGGGSNGACRESGPPVGLGLSSFIIWHRLLHLLPVFLSLVCQYYV